MGVVPVEIRKLAAGTSESQDSTGELSGIQISWSDRSVGKISALVLRKACPCAECQERRGLGEAHEAPLTAGIKQKSKRSLMIVDHSMAESIGLKEIWPIGNYALGVRWADGHDAGIFTYALLWELSQERDSSSGATKSLAPSA